MKHWIALQLKSHEKLALKCGKFSAANLPHTYFHPFLDDTYPSLARCGTREDNDGL